MPNLGSSNSAANKDMLSKLWTNGVQLSDCGETLWEKEKLLLMSNFHFSHNVFRNSLLLMHQNEYLWSKGLNKLSYDIMRNLISKTCKAWI